MTDIRVLARVAERAEAMEQELGLPSTNRMTRLMDLDYANRSVPIDFDALIASDNQTFAHDVFGITQHMNRSTKVLGNCFVPRTAIKA